METLEIRNIKTSKTERQIQDEVLTLKSKKNIQLVNTDWTQLGDVTLANVEEFKSWRRELRNFKIGDRSDSSKLEEIISRKPSPIFSATTVIPETPPNDIVPEPPTSIDILGGWKYAVELSVPIKTQLDIKHEPMFEHIFEKAQEEDTTIVCISSREEAINTLIEFMMEEKSEELRMADSSSYALFRLLQEELIEYDYKTDDSPPKFLEKYMTAVGLDSSIYSDLVKVEQICKDYFSRINEIFFRFEEQTRRVYNMSNKELELELDNRGHRYRPTH